MDSEPGSRTATPDVLGVAGYATKTQFRPPVDTRMLEGFAEWVWLTHMITSDSSLIKIGGVNTGIHHYCKSCDTYHQPDDDCGCEPLFVEDDFFGFNDHSGGTGSNTVVKVEDRTQSGPQDMTQDSPLGSSLTLNSVGPTRWIKKGISLFVEKTVRLQKRVREAVQGMRYPRWTRGP